MAHALECVAGDGAERRCRVACTHVDGISGMAKVVDAYIVTRLVRPDAIARRCRQAKSRGCKSIGERFEGERRKSVRQAKETANDSTKGMASKPYIGLGIALCHVMVEVAHCPVVLALLPQRPYKTSRVASVS